MSKAHTDLVNDIRVHMSSIGAVAVKVDTPGLLYDRSGTPVRVGTKGVWDTLHCLRGRFVAVEAKIGRDQLKEPQRRFGEAVRRAGGVTIVAWSIADLVRRLAEEGLTPCT